MQLRCIAGKDSSSGRLVDTELDDNNKEGHDGDGMMGERANKPSAAQGSKTGMVTKLHDAGLLSTKANNPSAKQNDKEGLLVS